jgi:hypothetical protein
VVVMAIIIALLGNRASSTLVCLGGAATWLVVVWALTAAKEKEVLGPSTNLAETPVSVATGRRADSDIKQSVSAYHDAVYELLRDLVAEGVVAEEALEKLFNDPSRRARAAEHSLYRERYELALRRLAKLRELTPPAECTDIHDSYMKSFTIGVEARRHELEGDHLKASAEYQLASDELGRATDLWEKMGVGPSL